MTVEEFIHRAEKTLDQFKIEYKMFNASDPTTFPENWDYPQWWDELYTFLLFQGVVAPEPPPPDNIKYIPE